MNLGYIIAQNCLGIAEIPGEKEHPMIRWAFDVAGLPQAHDDTEAWCGAFQALTSKLAGLPIPSHPARARSWLTVGTDLPLSSALEGDTVILMRGEGKQPGPEVLAAQGHVGRVAALDLTTGLIAVLAGNQKNSVSVVSFPIERVLGIRRV